MAKVISEDMGAFSQHYPKLATIVTAQAQGRENAMAVAWHTCISRRPPLYGISLPSTRFTYRLIIDSQEFGVNFLPFEKAELIAAVGGSGGQQVDKFQKFNIAREKPSKTSVPILKAAYAAYECRLIDDREYGDHNLLVGEIVAVHLLKEAFTEEEILDLAKVSPVLYLGNDLYASTSSDTLKHLDRKVYGQQV